MKTYVKINEILYPATIVSKIEDKDWDNRASKTITLEMSHTEATTIFVNDIIWYVVQEVAEVKSQYDEELKSVVQKTIIVEKEYDNSAYSIAGDIIDHRNGFITVKMGKPSLEIQNKQLEQKVEQLKIENAEYDAALTEIEQALEVDE